jgi:DNA-binding transcriptional LysR family regulator
VPGVTPDKWIQRWRERQRRSIMLVPVEEADQEDALLERRVDLCFVRSGSRTDDLHLIALYEEAMVVMVSNDHVVSAFEEVSDDELIDENVLPMAGSATIDMVAADAGVVIVPQSVARLHRRRDVTYRPVNDHAHSRIGLSWRSDTTDPGIETFIGIVRGRTERSSRG